MKDIANKGEAERCRDIAKNFLDNGEYAKASMLFAKSWRLYELPGVENLRAIADGKLRDAHRDPGPPTDLYRGTSVGRALVQALQQMIAEGSISSSTAQQIIENYDAAFLKTMREVVTDDVSTSVEITGSLSCFNNLHGLWRVDVEGAEVLAGHGCTKLDRIRLSCEVDDSR